MTCSVSSCEHIFIEQFLIADDSRLSLFITHCGQGSTTEATTAGVPLIVIPILGDQLRNAAVSFRYDFILLFYVTLYFQVIKRIETGLVLDKEALENSNILEKALRDALHNEKYEFYNSFDNKKVQISY